MYRSLNRALGITTRRFFFGVQSPLSAMIFTQRISNRFYELPTEVLTSFQFLPCTFIEAD
jgi:hypothetical protein